MLKVLHVNEKGSIFFPGKRPNNFSVKNNLHENKLNDSKLTAQRKFLNSFKAYMIYKGMLSIQSYYYYVI